jgi:hypothetical protein
MAGKIIALLSVAPALVAGSTTCYPGCATCTGDGWTECTSCDAGYTFDSTFGTCDWSYDESHACHWGDDDTEDFYAKLIVGTIAGAIFTIICLIVTSLPVCCGVMKTNLSGLKIIGVVTGIVSGISIAIPAITGMIVGGTAVEDYCNECGGCTDNDREEAKSAIAGLGVIVAYIHAFGFVVVILAIVGISLSCCLCCPCCGPLQAEKQKQMAGGTGAPPGQVVGQPVS